MTEERKITPEELEGMVRGALKKYIKDQGLSITVTKNMSDEDIRKGILSTLISGPVGDKSAGSENYQEELEDEEIPEGTTYYSHYLGLHVGHIKFTEGSVTLTDPADIEFIESNPKFGQCIFKR